MWRLGLLLALVAVLTPDCLGLRFLPMTDLQAAHCPQYDLSTLLPQFNVQFCTIVEIGQGYCTLFAELRKDVTKRELNWDRVAEVFLGSCLCSEIKKWTLCSRELEGSRGGDCRFGEGGYARVHRRICDLNYIAREQPPCQCDRPLAKAPFYHVKGFPTCYQCPFPGSICDHNSVCGTWKCNTRSIYGLNTVQCDNTCKYSQPFCEDPGFKSSEAPVVESSWSDWLRVNQSQGSITSQAVCLSKDRKSPAFDCLGPGSYCCPQERKCVCDVTTSPDRMLVTRYISYKRGSQGLNENHLVPHKNKIKLN